MALALTSHALTHALPPMTDLSLAGGSVAGRLGVTARMDDGRLTLDLVPIPETMHHGLVRASVLAYVVDAVTGLSVDSGTDLPISGHNNLASLALMIAAGESARQGRAVPVV